MNNKIHLDKIKNIFKKRRKNYNKNFKKLKKGNRSEKVIHDARVSARKMNALIKMLDIINNKSHKKLSKKIKKSRKKLGKSRDLQVAKKYFDNHKKETLNFDLLFFNEYYRKNIELEIKKTNKYLKKYNRKKINKNLKSFIKKFLKYNEDYVDLEDVFFLIKKERNKLINDFNMLDKKDPDTFHQLRKNLKKLRYKLEILNYIDCGNYTIEDYKNFQDDLGKIQDLVVIKKILLKAFDKKNTKENLESIIDYIDNEEEKMKEKFINSKQKFLKIINKI